MSSAPRKKLIEVALPLEDINAGCQQEKNPFLKGHPRSLHLWWARRPLAACRAVLFASLVDDPSERVQELLADSARRRDAEKKLREQKRGWEERKTLFEKAHGVGMTSVPDPGPEPKLEEIIAETERERLFEIIREMVKWENSNNERVLNRAREEIRKSTNGKPPPVYDPFCGGGSIPLEAQRLGLEAHASDLNPVPVLITKALIEIPPKFAGKPPVNPESRRKFGASGSWKGAAGLAEDIRYYSQWMRDEAEKRIGHFYPKVKMPKEQGGGEGTVVAWLWARTCKCPNPACGATMPLVRSFWLSIKTGKKAWIEPILDKGTKEIHFKVRTDEGTPRDGTVLSKRGAVCLFCENTVPFSYIRAEGCEGKLGTTLIGIVAQGVNGRRYLDPVDSHRLISSQAHPSWIPETELPEKHRSISAQLWGFDQHGKLFTPRQLVALTTYSDLVKEASSQVQKDALRAGWPEQTVHLRDGGNGATAYAEAVATYLAFALSQLTRYSCSLATWNTTNQNVAQAFGRQAMAMVWDFAECNPIDGVLSISSTAEWVASAVQFLPATVLGQAQQQDALLKLTGPEAVFCTDPPYYDNVGYADLADFFYVWLREAIGHFWPDLFKTVLTPKDHELIASRYRSGGSKDQARKFFEEGFHRAFANVVSLQHQDYPATVFYAFKQSEDRVDDEHGAEIPVSTGWETMLEGLVGSRLAVTGTWPLRTERIKGLKGSINALASSIVLVCRPRRKEAGVASRREFLAALKKELPEALRHLQMSNIAPVDLAQAAIGPGMAVFSRYAKVMESNGSAMTVRSALAEINKCLDEVLTEQEGEFDADTRWALAWFDQYGFTEGPYGMAETLSKAKNTSVSGMVEAGIVEAKSGKARLLKKEELPKDWNPDTDERLTVWEIVHYLIRNLEQSEAGAAALLKQLGSKGEVARDLAYRLYIICERRKWAKEALAYNALVLSWSDVTKLAQQIGVGAPVQAEMI